MIPGASQLGFGFDILGRYNVSSLTQSILTPVSGKSSTFTYGGVTYSVPDNVSVAQGTGDNTTAGTAFVAQSRQAFQTYFSEKAGLSGSYRGFSAEFDIFFATQAQSETMYWYGLVEGSYDAWVVTLDAVELFANFTSDPDVEKLMSLDPPVFNTQNADVFFRVFEKWGTHYVSQVTMGGGIDYVSAVETSFSSSETQISANLQLEYNAVFVDVAAKSQTDWGQLGEEWSQDRTATISATGGDTSLLNALDPTYGSNFSQAFQNWNKSIMTTPQIVGFGLRDISKLFSGDLAAATEDALSAYTNSGVYAQAQFVPAHPGFARSGLIELGGKVVATPTPEPEDDSGGVLLTVFDGFSLSTLVNTGVWGTDLVPADKWDPLYQAVQGLTQQSYIVVLAAFGMYGSLYPVPNMVTWLNACGAMLEQWRELQQGYASGFTCNYVLVGQQGLPPGQAFEKFTADHTVPQAFANLSVPLTPPLGSGPYTLGGVTKAAVGVA